MPGRKRQPVGVKKPARGAAMAPPNVQGRRRGPMGRAAGSRAPKANPRDLYEADEADPEETRNAQRYDQVESYEYEMPSDFEDEEIDEEAAFTAEDKKKFGAWFDDIGGSDGEDGSEGFDDEEGLEEGEDDGEQPETGDDAGLDMLDSEDEGPAGQQQRAKGQAAAAGSKKRPRPQDESEESEGNGEDADEEQEMADVDDFLNGFGFDDSDGEGDGEDDDSGDEEAGGVQPASDDEAHNAMLAAVIGKQSRKKASASASQQQQQQQELVTEACPESEFGLNPGAASTGMSGLLTVEDLLEGLTPEERRKMTPASRKLLEKLSTQPAAAAAVAASGKKKGKQQGKAEATLAPVAAPLPRAIKERQERKAGYIETKEDVSKWMPIIKANREAPTVVFTSNRGEVGAISTTQAIASNHEAQTDMEKEVAALLRAAGAASTAAVQEAEEKLAMKHLTVEEVKARQDRLAKMRALLFYQELKAKRLKSIKSKGYHKRLAKAEKRRTEKLGKQDGGGGEEDLDKEAVREAEAQAEFERARERLTLKHRNTSQWARRALKRGIQVMDEGTKEAIAEQLRLGQELRKKIEGRGSGSEGGDSGDETSASDGGDDAGMDDAEGVDAGTSHPGLSSRAKLAALKVLQGASEEQAAPKKGLFSLPFMARALQKQRLEAKAEAEQMLQELEEEEAGSGSDQEGIEGAEGMEGVNGDGAPGTSGAALGRARFGGMAAAQQGPGGRAAAAAAPFGFGSDGEDEDGDAEGRLDLPLDGQLSDDEEVGEGVEAKAQRLGRRLAGAGAEDAQGTGKAGKDRKSAAAGLNRPPTADELRDLQEALARAGGGSAAAISLDLNLNLKVGSGSRGGNAAAQVQAAAAAAAAMGDRATGAKAGLGPSSAVLAAAAFSAARKDLFEGSHHKSPAAGAAGTGEAAFVASKKFAGARQGYVFRSGPQGLGYYADASAAARAVIPAAAGSKGQKGGAATAAAVAGAGPGSKQSAAQQAATERQKTHRQQRRGLGEGAGAAADLELDVTPAPDQGARGANGTAPAAAAAEKAVVGGAAVVVGHAGGSDDEGAVQAASREGMQPAPGKKAAAQAALVSMAFAGDDVEAEFEEMKAAAVAEELPKVEAPSTLPGWGMWSGQQRQPRWMRDAQAKAEETRRKAAASRQDARSKTVVISEKWDSKAAKYLAPSLPFPYKDKDAYEGSLRQPLGREYNPDTAFRNLTRPAVLKNNGVVIAPARFSEGVAQHAASGATVASNGVARIAGGMVQMAGPVDKEKVKGKGKGKGAGGGKGGGGKPGAKRVKT